MNDTALKLFVAVLCVSFALTGGSARSAEAKSGSPDSDDGLCTDSIQIEPAGDTSVVAGSAIVFKAYGFTRWGSRVLLQDVEWSLSPDSDPIGFFTDSVLTVTRVGSGRVRATLVDDDDDEVFGESGIITVRPGSLSRMNLEVGADQLKNHSLINQAQIVLYDDYDNLVTDHDLSVQPIQLLASVGSLQPDLLDDDSLLENSVVDLLAGDVAYAGNSAIVDMYARSNLALSQTVSISFNGYEILDVLDHDSVTISTMSRVKVNWIKLLFQNNGMLAPANPIRVRVSTLLGNIDMSATVNSTANGTVDTLNLTLPPYVGGASVDSLVIELEADFVIAGVMYTVAEELIIPVTIEFVGPNAELVAGSFLPTSIIEEVPFDISFDATIESFTGSVDSASVFVGLGMATGEILNIRLFVGTVYNPAVNGDVVEFRSLGGLLGDFANVPAGNYVYTVDLDMYTSEGHSYLNDIIGDPVTVLPSVSGALTYVASSLAPDIVYSDEATAFSFVLNLNNDVPAAINLEQSGVTVTGYNFEATVGLRADTQPLLPGPNRLEAEPIFIPESQQGMPLTISAKVVWGGAFDRFPNLFETDFNGETVTVEQAPVIQIVHTDLIAPNAPHVNTGQPFEIACEVANLSPRPVDNLRLFLTSDGQSTFESELTIARLEGESSLTVYFDVVADVAPSMGEIFQLTLEPNRTGPGSYLDNTTIAQIEYPASLRMEYSLIGAEDGTVSLGREFGLIVDIFNDGEAQVGPGQYVVTSDGVDLGLGDKSEGEVIVGDGLRFSMRAPDFDTVFTLGFRLTDIPIDLNSDSQAAVDIERIEVTIRVRSLEADLEIDVIAAESYLVLPGRPTSLFELLFANLGSAADYNIALNRLSMVIVNRLGESVNAASLIAPGSTGFEEYGVFVTTAYAAGDRIEFEFSDFVIGPGETRAIQFVLDVIRHSEGSLDVRFPLDGIEAVFADGPLAGLSPRIVSEGDGESLVAVTITTKRGSFAESIVLRDNPFNPDMGPAEISYELAKSTAVEIRVFTLTGELVYERFVSAGSTGGSAGENRIEWDGRNGRGDMVHNGVYVVSVRNAATGEASRIKIAMAR